MANVDDSATCEHCGRPLTTQHGKGRRRRFCDATCRSAARRDRTRPVKARLTPPARKGNLDTGTPLDAVAAAREHARAAEEALRVAVDRAREAGHTWHEIGDVLGTSRQAAFQRFGRPIDPRTGVPMQEAVLPGVTEHAIELLGEIVAGNWERVRRDFDATMTAEFDADQLAAGWAQAVGMVGGYEGMTEPLCRQFGDYTVVDIPLRFEAGEIKCRVSYDQNGKVAGLRLMPEDAL